MIDRLVVGQCVTVAHLGHHGVIVSVQNDGMFGTLKTEGGSRFTVLAGECHPTGARMSGLDAMLAEVGGPLLEWKRPEVMGDKHSISSYIGPMLKAERAMR
jgi:hypothetical protein